MISIVCFFWVDGARQRSYQITPNDVRIWDRMVARHVTVPHRRICATHRPDLINFMETVPLDVRTHVPGTCLTKLMVWHPDIAETLGERILTMDVDTVIVGNIDHIVTAPEPRRFWANPNFTVGGRRGYIQGSIQLLSAGAGVELWNDFCPNRTPGFLNRRFGGAEQAWLSERMNTSWPDVGWEWNEAVWTDEHGIFGAGRLFGGQMGAGVQSELPENARVVFFPGDRSPSQPEVRQAHPWIERFVQ